MRYELHWGDARIRSIQDLTPGIRQFQIEPSAGVVRYSPGSHINVRVMIGERPEFRSYSLVGEPLADGAYRIAVRRNEAGFGGSKYLWGLSTGARLTVSNPQNLFELGLHSPEYLLIAGGIGITPILGMAYELERLGANFRLLYAGRTRGDMAFVPELSSRLGPRLHLRVSDENGRIHLERELEALHSDAEVYLCGPLPMLDAAKRIWRALDRRTSNLRFETFGSSGRFAPEAFAVHVKDLGKTVVVPEDRSMLDALADAGIPVMCDCMRGECGLCTVEVIEHDGELDHRDVFLNDVQKAAGNRLCACVSRAIGGSITIDTGYRP